MIPNGRTPLSTTVGFARALDMNTKITCVACATAIAPKAMHIFMGATVVCRTCAGTKAAHRLTGCPVDWHDGLLIRKDWEKLS